MNDGIRLAGIIAAGILSRMIHTGWILIDKYLGDALYAAMVYTILRMTGRVPRVALASAAAMIAIECFQLTGIPAAWSGSDVLFTAVVGRLLGTHFSWLDLAAYAAGIAAMAGTDSLTRTASSRSGTDAHPEPK